MEEIDIIDLEPTAIAEQFCYIDQSLLIAIQPFEFLKKSFLDPAKSVAYSNMVESWNRRSLWVVTEILKRDKLPKRIAAICLFIKIAEVLLWK